MLKQFEHEGKNTSLEYTGLRQDIACIYINKARVFNTYPARKKAQKREYYKKAKEACETAISLNPECFIAYRVLGEALKGLGDKRDSDRAFMRAAKLEEQNSHLSNPVMWKC